MPRSRIVVESTSAFGPASVRMVSLRTGIPSSRIRQAIGRRIEINGRPAPGRAQAVRESLHEFLDGCTRRHHLRVPIYDFHCDSCDSTFEELTRADELPRCPDCGHPE